MRDPELVARAQRAAARLESAWEQWRVLHGLAVAPAQPVVSYVGYSLKEPWGEPRVVIGIDADEAEFLAEFLDRDECANIASIANVANAGQLPAPRPTAQANPAQQQHGMLPQARLAEPPQPQEGEYTSQALLGAPVSLGLPRQADPGRDMSVELAGWSAGELPGQASEHHAGWPPPGMKAVAEQPPGAA